MNKLSDDVLWIPVPYSLLYQGRPGTDKAGISASSGGAAKNVFFCCESVKEFGKSSASAD